MTTLRSYRRMVLLALIWGSSFLWIKLALGGFQPLELTFGRLLLGAIVLYAIVRASGQRLPRGRALWLRMLVPAIVGNAIPFSLFAFGEQTVDSGVAGVLNATTPLWALIIGLFLGSERWSNVTKLAGLLLGFGGVLLIFAPWQASGLGSWGALGCLLAAACYAVSYTYIARVLSAKVSPLGLATSQLGMSSIMVAAAIPVSGEFTVHLGVLAAIAVGVLGVFGTGIAFLLNNRIIAEEGATAAASVGYLLPVVSVTLGAITLGEPLTIRVIAGMAAVLAGVVLSRHKSAKPVVHPPEPVPATT